MILIEFSPETNWKEIKAVLSKHEKEYSLFFDSVNSIWEREGKKFVCFRGIK